MIEPATDDANIAKTRGQPARFSVVVPLFNKAGQIERALTSVFSQSVAADEVIVVDDGSTDGSFDVAKALQERFEFTLHRKPNGGVSRARNDGAKLARNEYVCFLDADDEWHRDHLSEIASLLEKAEERPILISTRNCYRKADLGTRRANPRQGIQDAAFDTLAEISRAVSSSSACVRKDKLFEIGGFPEGVKHGEDLYLWYRLILQGPVAFSAMCGAVVHDDAPSRTSRSTLMEVPYHIVYFTEADLGKKYLEHKSLRRLLEQSATRNSMRLSLLSSPRAAIDFIKRSFRIGPKAGLAVCLITLVPLPIRSKLLKLRLDLRS